MNLSLSRKTFVALALACVGLVSGVSAIAATYVSAGERSVTFVNDIIVSLTAIHDLEVQDVSYDDDYRGHEKYRIDYGASDTDPDGTDFMIWVFPGSVGAADIIGPDIVSSVGTLGVPKIYGGILGTEYLEVTRGSINVFIFERAGHTIAVFDTNYYKMPEEEWSHLLSSINVREVVGWPGSGF